MQQTIIFDVRDSRREPEAQITLTRRDDGVTVTIDAAALLAQHLLPWNDVLLVLDEDTPYEEQMHLVLVRGERILDHIVIGALYASGTYREAGSDGSALRFRFESDAIWTLTAREQGARGLSALPSGAKRRSGWLTPHHLFLSREQGE